MSFVEQTTPMEYTVTNRYGDVKKLDWDDMMSVYSYVDKWYAENDVEDTINDIKEGRISHPASPYLLEEQKDRVLELYMDYMDDDRYQKLIEAMTEVYYEDDERRSEETAREFVPVLGEDF